MYTMFNNFTSWLLTWLDSCQDGDEFASKVSWDNKSELVYVYYNYTVHIEIFPSDLISWLVMRDRGVCMGY